VQEPRASGSRNRPRPCPHASDDNSKTTPIIVRVFRLPETGTRLGVRCGGIRENFREGFAMKNLIRASVVALLALPAALLAGGQDGSTRAEFECLLMANSSRVVAPGEPSTFPSYHHVWTTELRYGSFQSHGLSLTYETQGEGPEVIIVVHGGVGLPHDYFHPMLTNLTRDAKLVFFDRRADMLAEGKAFQMASVEEMADDVEALRQSLGLDKVTLLAHSFGGMVALDYALRHPSHLKRLILVNTSAVVEDPREAEQRIVKTLSPAELAVYSGEGGTGGANPCERVRRRYGVLYPHYFYKLIPYEFDRGVYAVYFDALAKKIALASGSRGVDLRGRLHDIQAPAIVFAGRHDLVAPLDQARELAGGLPNAKLVVMQQSAHFTIFEENYLFSRWVHQFLANTSTLENEVVTTSPDVSTSAGK
jgi:proline iminopeptidase